MKQLIKQFPSLGAEVSNKDEAVTRVRRAMDWDLRFCQYLSGTRRHLETSP